MSFNPLAGNFKTREYPLRVLGARVSEPVATITNLAYLLGSYAAWQAAPGVVGAVIAASFAWLWFWSSAYHLDIRRYDWQKNDVGAIYSLFALLIGCGLAARLGAPVALGLFVAAVPAWLAWAKRYDIESFDFIPVSAGLVLLLAWSLPAVLWLVAAGACAALGRLVEGWTYETRLHSAGAVFEDLVHGCGWHILSAIGLAEATRSILTAAPWLTP